MPTKKLIMRINCPRPVVYRLVRGIVDQPSGRYSWKLLSSDEVNGILTAVERRLPLEGAAKSLRVTVRDMGRSAPNETAVEAVCEVDGMGFIVGGKLEQKLGELERAITEKVAEAVASNEAAAYQWRPKV